MRWSVVRLITLRETRDLLRDRRTVMLILVLPARPLPVLRPGRVTLFALSMTEQTTVVGVVGGEHLPTGTPDPSGKPPFPAPLRRRHIRRPDHRDRGRPRPARRQAARRRPGRGRPHPGGGRRPGRPGRVRPGPGGRQQADTRVLNRDGDERSKLAARRLTAIVRKWEDRTPEVKLARAGLPKDFHVPFVVEDPHDQEAEGEEGGRRAPRLLRPGVPVHPDDVAGWPGRSSRRWI